MQEATKPVLDASSGVRLAAPPSPKWKIQNGWGAHATGIAVTKHGVEFLQVPVTELGAAGDGEIGSTHPGQFTIVKVPWGKYELTLISLYGIFHDGFADASLHRALSDLTPILERKSPVLIAGDLNTFRGHTLKGTAPSQGLRRHDTVFSRFAAFGLECLGPFSSAGPLKDCPCLDGVNCTHIQTYRHMNQVDHRPFQLDFVFGSKVVQERMISCRVLDDARWWAESDHAPIEVVLGK